MNAARPPNSKTKLLVWLTIRRWKNKFRLWLQRIRKPSNLIPFVLGMACLIFVLCISLMENKSAGKDKSFFVLEHKGGIAFAFFFFTWLTGMLASWKTTGIAFLPGDVNYLFPGPISKRGVLNYKLAQHFFLQLSTLTPFLSMVAFFYLSPGGLGWQQVFCVSIAVFLMLQLVSNSTMMLTLLLQKDSRGYRRRSLGLIALSSYLLAALGIPAFITFDLYSSGLSWPLIGKELASSELLRFALFPFAMLSDMAVSHSANAMFWSHGLCLGLLILGMFWLMGKIKVNYYETSADISLFTQRLTEAIRTFGPFSQEARQIGMEKARKRQKAVGSRLPMGRGVWCLLWKNLTLEGRNRITLYFLPGIPVVIGILSFAINDPEKVLLFLLAGVTPFFLWISGMQCDLRRSVRHLQLLKAFPFSSQSIAAVEILCPALIFTSLFLSSLAVFQFYFQFNTLLILKFALLSLPFFYLFFGWMNFCHLKFAPHNFSKFIGRMLTGFGFTFLLFACGFAGFCFELAGETFGWIINISYYSAAVWFLANLTGWALDHYEAPD